MTDKYRSICDKNVEVHTDGIDNNKKYLAVLSAIS